MLQDRWFKIGLVGAVIAAICCFTPVMGVVLGAVGLAAYAAWFDAVLFPALMVFIGIAVTAMIRLWQHR